VQRPGSANIDTLPVVKGQKRFAGIVKRRRLTPSLLIDVSKSLVASKDAVASWD